MKFLLIVCGLLVALGGVIVSCGPQKDYCPNGPNGECGNNSSGSGGGGGVIVDADQGESTIITGTGGQ
jgi:hypothetical protein